MYTIHDPRALINATIDRLEAEANLLVGDATRPSGVTYLSNGLPSFPYAVVYGGPDGDSTGTIDDPDADVWLTFTVTSIGGSRDHCSVGQRIVREALVGWQPQVSGVSFSLVELAQGTHPDQDTDVQPPVFFAPDEFRVFCSPDPDFVLDESSSS